MRQERKERRQLGKTWVSRAPVTVTSRCTNEFCCSCSAYVSYPVLFCVRVYACAHHFPSITRVVERFPTHSLLSSRKHSGSKEGRMGKRERDAHFMHSKLEEIRIKILLHFTGSLTQCVLSLSVTCFRARRSRSKASTHPKAGRVQPSSRHKRT